MNKTPSVAVSSGMATPIKDRILAALRSAGGSMSYNDCMLAVFPPQEYPKAWRYQQNGGPPGCAMAFGRAVRELRCGKWGSLSARMISMPPNA